MKTSDLKIDELYQRRIALGDQLILLLDTKQWTFNSVTDKVIRPGTAVGQLGGFMAGLPALHVTPWPSAGAAPIAELEAAVQTFRETVRRDNGYPWGAPEPVREFDTSAGTVRILPILVQPRQLVRPWSANVARYAHIDGVSRFDD